ncbi:DUF1641 domain-containing protein [Halorussus ruber]|uniref:DUF1641 domain-containing protein n=1 Tax=Halorussus ruber TaxID=1126238 RepID=UPI001092A164|nr:DUF1641 domain-containing protein [Halorussus ruber]
MSEPDSTQEDAVTEAIADHSEEVTEFAERLDVVNELLASAELGMAALDDDMVVSLAGTGESLGELADASTEPETARGLRTLVDAVGEVEADDSVPEEMGPLALVGALGDPDVQRGLGYLVAVAQALGRNVRENGEESG